MNDCIILVKWFLKSLNIHISEKPFAVFNEHHWKVSKKEPKAQISSLVKI